MNNNAADLDRDHLPVADHLTGDGKGDVARPGDIDHATAAVTLQPLAGLRLANRAPDPRVKLRGRTPRLSAATSFLA